MHVNYLKYANCFFVKVSGMQGNGTASSLKSILRDGQSPQTSGQTRILAPKTPFIGMLFDLFRIVLFQELVELMLYKILCCSR